MTQSPTLSNYIIVKYEYEFDAGLPAVFYHVQEQQDLSKIIPWSLDDQKVAANKTDKTSPWDKAIMNAIDCKEERVKECVNVPKDVALLCRDLYVKSIDLQQFQRLNKTQTSDLEILNIVTAHIVNYYQSHKQKPQLANFNCKTTLLRDKVVALIMNSVILQGEWFNDKTIENAFDRALLEISKDIGAA